MAGVKKNSNNNPNNKTIKMTHILLSPCAAQYNYSMLCWKIGICERALWSHGL